MTTYIPMSDTPYAYFYPKHLAWEHGRGRKVGASWGLPLDDRSFIELFATDNTKAGVMVIVHLPPKALEKMIRKAAAMDPLWRQ